MLLPDSLASKKDQLRIQLPATLQAKLWIQPTESTLLEVIKHLRTLRYLLFYYLPFSVSEHLLETEQPLWQWNSGTLMFTDLAGFTALTQTCSQQGAVGSRYLAKLINTYFSRTIEIISASEGDLLEFTGDATLVKFDGATPEQATAKAVRAGLRLQRMMTEFNQLETFGESQSLGMRIGIHSGQFLTADVGTPMRMMRILLGQTVRCAKNTESFGKVGRVCISEETAKWVQDSFRLTPHQEGYFLIEDDMTSESLGRFEITPQRRRFPRSMLFNNSSEEMMREINHLLKQTAPLSKYIAPPVLKLLVENARDRAIPPTLSQTAVLFINLIGIPERIDSVKATTEQEQLIHALSYLFAQINALIEAKEGFLQNWTYHRYSDILAYFGVPNSRTDDAIRATTVATQIRQLISQFPEVEVGQQKIPVSCQIGLAWGTVFAGEIGQPYHRRDYNALGAPVNRAAYVMSQAPKNQIWITNSMVERIELEQNLLNLDDLPFHYQLVQKLRLKGSKNLTPIFEIISK
ncbi:adenylate/guanylate cyclase domain-containing protein [Euhalothece natronophila Z-M001]|uniref:Adenylate/guanylate cyclase domain-containing protein n=1 Tax=Euhalothece natronophila Z-M001 TaxID=522448 RepID=A0A5B8NJ10_9CHRO|nr:adenylate/guanylate cyclase domain-containing protein [Euhalothece natronophila]QDZ38927.1 adenylate/guanylate cyclase domain-containing protein [Euhalothece natronophila Z-M001]